MEECAAALRVDMILIGLLVHQSPMDLVHVASADSVP
jgi:hypothetical protein